MTGLTRRDAARALAATAVMAVAGVPAEAGTADPIYGLIEKADAARAVYDTENARIKALEAKIPAEIRDWPGAYCGTWETTGGTRPYFHKAVRHVKRHYDGMLESKHLVGSARAKVEHMRMEAIFEAKDMNRRERAAYRDVGLPFTPDAGKGGGDEYFKPYYDRMWDAEGAVSVCGPTTVAGLLAKLRFLTARPELEGIGGQTSEQVADRCGRLSEEHYLVRLGEDAARLAEDVL